MSATRTIYAETSEVRARLDPDGVVRWDPPRLTADQVIEEMRDMMGRAEDQARRATAVYDALFRQAHPSHPPVGTQEGE